MDKASLVIVGSGIKFLSHITTEAKAYIEQSEKVLYLVNEVITKEWIQHVNPSSESLDELYNKFFLRSDSYQAITNYILETVKRNMHVCVVLYGHPSVFAKPGLDAVHQAKKEGFYTKILPGISAEDCLFSDLMIDPGSCGCQSFEATDFLIHRKKYDNSAHLILWQIDIIGVRHNPSIYNNEKGIKLLVNFLNEQYSIEHEVFIYEAAQYPGFEAKIIKTALKMLHKVHLSSISTLYIPPSKKAHCDEAILKMLSTNE